ncbi:paeninodin family lasso peptide [Guptibacillus spartinae]|nr:paeninodin family lasso peptide [Pseudalkalibacillus spartinae]
MKKEWKKPTLESLDVKMTMKFHHYYPPSNDDDCEPDFPGSLDS